MKSGKAKNDTADAPDVSARPQLADTDVDSANGTVSVLATELGVELQRRGFRLATIESCTGGLLAAAITSVAGSSEWFGDGVISYSNAAKQRFAAVDPAVIDREGAVSEATVLAMASGFRQRVGADIAVSISGIAGPGGATVDKPLGTVWIGWAGPGTMRAAEHHVFAGNRHDVRQAAVVSALRGTISRLDNGAFQRE